MEDDNPLKKKQSTNTVDQSINQTTLLDSLPCLTHAWVTEKCGPRGLTWAGDKQSERGETTIKITGFKNKSLSGIGGQRALGHEMPNLQKK